MWTTIASRARTALTVFVALLTMVLIVAAILFATQWAWPAQTHTYQSYSLEVSPPPPAPWHPGQSLSLVWVPSEAGSGPGEPPASVTCQFWLYGPYATRAGAPTDQGGPMITGATPAASAPPLTLSTKVGTLAPGPVTYALPDTLAPGYYVVVAATQEGDPGGTSSAWVVQVTA